MSGSLVFDGNIELMSGVWHSDGYKVEAIEGVQFGDPVPVQVALASFLRDGSVVAHDRDENRELVLLVQVEAKDSLALNLASQRLTLATGKRTTVSWVPPDRVAPTTVFPVWTSHLGQPDGTFDDLGEVRHRRTYQLTLTCEPSSRSKDLILDDADTPPSTGTVVESCDTATAWSSATGGTPTDPPTVDASVFVEGTGSVRCEAFTFSTSGFDEYGNPYASARNRDTVTMAVNTGAGGYMSAWVRIDWDGHSPSKLNEITIRQTTSSGLTSVPWTQVQAGADRWVRFSWPVAPGLVVTSLEFEIAQYRSRSPGSSQVTVTRPFVRYDSIVLSTAATTDQQIVKTFNVEGSKRTPGSLHVVAPDDGVALGDVLVVTVPEAKVQPGFRPDVRRWVTAGSTTTDSTALHGSYYDPSTVVFDVPVTMLRTGPYDVVALLKTAGSTLTGTVTAQLLSGSTLTGPVSTTTVSVPNPTSEWRMVSLGSVYLPPVPVMKPTAGAKVRIKFTGSNGSVADAFLIPVDADFTIARCGSGTVSTTGASSHLWIDSPDADQVRGGYWRGPLSDRVDARSAWADLPWPGQHEFAPGPMRAFLVSTKAQGPRLELSYFPRWHDFAALRRPA